MLNWWPIQSRATLTTGAEKETQYHCPVLSVNKTWEIRYKRLAVIGNMPRSLSACVHGTCSRSTYEGAPIKNDQLPKFAAEGGPERRATCASRDEENSKNTSQWRSQQSFWVHMDTILAVCTWKLSKMVRLPTVHWSFGGAAMVNGLLWSSELGVRTKWIDSVNCEWQIFEAAVRITHGR